jgi:pimeloyl-ACP methyl ester carboxylesterase
MKRVAALMLPLLFLLLGVGGDGAAAPQGKTITANSTNMAYIEQGQGPSLVLVHGTLVDSRYWAAQVEQFAARYRVVAVSLRHHYPNASTGDLSDYGMRAHAADVAR